MGTVIFIIIVIFVIAIFCGAKPGEALGGILVGLFCIAQYLLPILLFAWIVSLFLR